MNASRWAQVEKIYHGALELSAPQRLPYLAKACGDDADLRREVESLLAQAKSGASPMDRPAWEGATSLLSQDTLKPGSTLGPYEITGVLGEGGMGRVYSARDSRLGRSVAIKFSTGDFGERFRQEARAVAALNHPNICTLHDIGPNYLVMELVDGETLAQRLKQGAMPVPECLAIARQIAEALEAAHEQGIVHRDLKPSNIQIKANGPMHGPMLGPMRGTVKVIDFGLAKSQSAGPADQSVTMGVTEPGSIMGSAAYMAPEQAAGKPVDRRADIWAFGVVLAEMLTGRRVFQGDTVAETMASVLKDAPPLERLPKETPPAVRSLIARCLEKDPAQRLGSIAEAKAALVPPPQRQLAARQVWFATAAVAVLVLIATAVMRRPEAVPRPEPEPVVRPILTSPAAETQPALSPDGQYVAYASTVEGAKSADIYVKAIDKEDAIRLTNTPESEAWPRWSPEGKHIVFGRPRDKSVQLVIVPAAGGVERVLGEYPGIFPGVAWHPNGRYLAFSAMGPAGLQQLDIETGAVSTLTHPPAGALGDARPAYLPDGRRLAFFRFKTEVTGTVEVLDLASGRQRTYPVDGQLLEIGVEGPDELILSMNSSGGPYRRLNLADGSLQVLRQLPGNLVNASLSANGQRMVAQQLIRDTNIWRLPLPKPGVAGNPERWFASTLEDYDPRYAPQGGQVLITSRRTGTVKPWLLDREGRAPRLLEIQGPFYGSPRWSPDGRRIAYDIRVNGSAQVMAVSALGGAPTQMTFDSFENIVPSWSHDRRWIYYCSNRTGRQEVWRVPAAGGKSEQVTRTGGFESQESRDGRYLFFSRNRATPMIVRRAADGTEETLITDLGQRAWVAGADGIYHMNQARTQMMYYDFVTRKSVKVLSIGKTVPVVHRTIDLSPNGRELLWAQVDSLTSDIVLVERLR